MLQSFFIVHRRVNQNMEILSSTILHFITEKRKWNTVKVEFRESAKNDCNTEKPNNNTNTTSNIHRLINAEIIFNN